MENLELEMNDVMERFQKLQVQKQQSSDNQNKNTQEKNKKIEETTFFNNIFIDIIKSQKEKEDKQDIWKNSPYKDLVKLQSNNVGIVGEKLINELCKVSGIDSNCDGSKTKKIGGGVGDGTIKGIPVEIKTALQGSKSQSFQHELGEVPWQGGKYMIFVDVAPNCVYLTILENITEEKYKSDKKFPCIPNKKITWRKEKGAFKFDTSVKINENNIINGHAIKITSTTRDDDIDSFASFINGKILRQTEPK